MARKKKFDIEIEKLLKELPDSSYIKTLLKESKKKRLSDKDGLKNIHKRFYSKFSATKEIPLSKIEVKPQIFQGRSVPYARETVKKIINEGFDKSFEPIVVYFDTKTGKNIVISGHSRFEAAKTLYKAGDKRLKTIPVKVFHGDLDDAIDFAVIESNRSGKAEGIESDIKAYMRAKSRAWNKNKLLGIFKSDSYLTILDNLSHLNPRGEFIKFLRDEDKIVSSSSKKNIKYPYLLRNASWVGWLRKMYPELTNVHERELFDCFYRTGTCLKMRKSVFYEKIKSKVENPRFNPKKGLALQRESVFEEIGDRDPLWIAYKTRLSAIDNESKIRLRKEKKMVEAMRMNKKNIAEKLKKEIDMISKSIHSKYAETLNFLDKLAVEDKKLKTSKLFD